MSTKSLISGAALIGLCSVALVTQSPQASAGTRTKGLAIVSMHEGDEADARRCYVQIRDALSKGSADETLHVRLSRSSFTRVVGQDAATTWHETKADKLLALKDWKPKRWRGEDGPSEWEATLDSVVMVDCDPQAQRLHISVFNIWPGTLFHMSFQATPVDKDLRSLATELVISQTWADWEP